MEILDFVLLFSVVIVAALLTLRGLSLADARARIKLEITKKNVLKGSQNRQMGIERAQMNLEGSQRPRARNVPERPAPGMDIGPWLPDLLEGFGINPDVIYDEVMPDDLAAFLPIIKGYVGAQGGLPGVLAKMQGQNADDGGSGQNVI